MNQHELNLHTINCQKDVYLDSDNSTISVEVIEDNSLSWEEEIAIWHTKAQA